MGINFFGLPLFILSVAAMIGILVGFVLKKKKVTQRSFIALVIITIIYVVLYFIFH